MAMSEATKLKKKNPREWLIIGNDASVNMGTVLSRWPTRAEANAHRSIFTEIRRETDEEYNERLAKLTS